MSSRDEPRANSLDEPKLDDSLQKAFARALNDELDRIGYPTPPARTNQLAHDLGLGRMQAFRIGRGDNMPTVKSMLKLQRLGVSLDAVLEQLQETKPEHIALEVLGVPIQAVALRASGRMPFVMTRKGGSYVLRVADPDEQLGADDIPVGGLRFTRPQPIVAVIEDDLATLEVFCSELSRSFNAVPFQNDGAFREDPSRLQKFDAVVLDWVLPTTDGASVVSFIRSHSRAPIVVTTGHREESPAISSILGMADLYYVAKPVEGEILRAMIGAAIDKGPNAPARRASAWATRRSSKPSG